MVSLIGCASASPKSPANDGGIFKSPGNRPKTPRTPKTPGTPKTPRSPAYYANLDNFSLDDDSHLDLSQIKDNAINYIQDIPFSLTLFSSAEMEEHLKKVLSIQPQGEVP